MMKFRRLFLLVALLLACMVQAEQQQQNDDANGNDDAAAGDDAAQAENDDGNAYANDDAADDDDDQIVYWTNYAILPKRCIVYNNVDVIVFSLFDDTKNQCTDTPMGTYTAAVPTFVDGYLEYYAKVQAAKGYDDYVEPDASQYTTCTQQVIENEVYYLQLGCSDDSTQQLAVNVYTDNTCTTRAIVDGYDDSNIDATAIQLPFKHCSQCVSWVDKNDDEVDDATYYENYQMDSPFCSTAWTYKQQCNRKCQKTGLEPREKEGWTTPDKILLVFLGIFGTGMLVAILRKRQKMSNKDALLEQAAMSAAGLQQAHVIGVFVLIVIVITVFALLQLKNITWGLMLIMNTALFGYLMKLTVDSGVSAGEAVIGPDGTIIRRADSDDSSMASSVPHGMDPPSKNAGTYHLPQIA